MRVSLGAVTIGRRLWVPTAIATLTLLLGGNVALAQQSGVTGSNAELYYKLQQLEQEVMTLRGQLEEQDHLIRKLQKQRLSDYRDLDRRISSLRGGGRPPVGAVGIGSYSGSEAGSVSRVESIPAPANAEAAPIPRASGSSEGRVTEALPSTGSPAPTPINTVSEKEAYDAAQALVKAQSFDEARSAFRKFTTEYPGGQYIANAHYWLGVLYTYEAQTDNAIKEFNTVVQSYPSHRKAPDALFKLAKAHHLRGDETTAKILLNRVATDYADSGDRAVQLAKDYLENEFGG